MDMKIAFPNSDLEEEIYISQSKGCTVLDHENKVCKLRKSLYDLKESPKQQYENFNRTVIQTSFVVNTSDSRVYSTVIDSDYVIICLDVHDMVIFGTLLMRQKNYCPLILK